MKNLRRVIFCLGLAGILPLGVLAQGTAFSYQGRLNDGANPANGLYDLRFKLYTDSLGNNQIGAAFLSNAVPVSNGLFVVALDFGAVFSGTNYWLEVDVKTNNAGAYANLSPLQALTPAPYAIYAGTAGGLNGALPSGSLSGTYGNVINFNNAANTFAGSFVGNGGALSNINASSLGGVGAAQFWQTVGNSNTTAGVNFLGTSDNQPLELRVNRQRALRLEPNTNGAPNVIIGSSFNSIAFNNSAATISGGMSNNIGSNSMFSTVGGGLYNTIFSNVVDGTIGGGIANTVAQNFATVGGGYGNIASGNFIPGGDSATVAGGFANAALGNNSVVGGGALNLAQGDNTFIGGGWYNTNLGLVSVIGGGQYNSIRGPNGTIGGGQNNTIQSNSYFGTVGGGAYNSIGTNSSSSTVAGGYNNSVAAFTTDVAIGGGSYNTVLSNTAYAAIAGGRGNYINNNAVSAAIGGGFQNTASGAYSVIPGGYVNQAVGSNSFAAGTLAYAGFNGSFVWSDSTAMTNFASFSATGPNQFLIRAAGGVAINTNDPGGAALQVAGTASASLFQGNGSGLTNLGAGNISGTLPDARLSGNVALLNASQTFSGAFNTFGDLKLENASASYHHLELSGGNALGYLYGSFYGLADGIHLGYNAYYDNAGLGHVFNSGGATSRITTGYGFVGVYVGGVNAVPTTTRIYADAGGVSVYGTFNNASDRNAKENFKSVDAAHILEGVLHLPITEWSYKEDASTRHIGPVAQDFSSIFNIGTDDKHIAPIDEGGVAFSAIQGLNAKMEAHDRKSEDRMARLEAENSELKARLEALEKLLRQKTSYSNN